MRDTRPDYPPELDDDDEAPCYREDFDGDTWQCVNDHTGCIWNNGNNGCSAPGMSPSPLEDEAEGEL